MVTGSNSNLFYTDKALTLERALDCHLSVLLDRDAIAWAVVERASGMNLEVGQTQLQKTTLADVMVEAPLQNAIQSRRYGSSSVAVRSCPFSLIPKSFYSPQHGVDVLNLLFGPSDRQVENNEISALDAVVVFSPSTDVTVLRQRLPEAKLFCNATLMIESVLRFSRFDGDVQLICDLSLTFMDLLVVADKRVVFCNSFDISSDEDALYHAHNTLQQLGLLDRATTLYVSGSIAVGGERYKLFEHYFEKVVIHFGFRMPKVAPALADLRKQEVMALLTQFACVS